MEAQVTVVLNTVAAIIQLCRMRMQDSTLCNIGMAKAKILLTVWRLTMDMIKVSANSRTSAVAGAIAGIMREHKHVEIQAIGASAVNQAVKAVVLATGYLRGDGIFVTCVPEFVQVRINDKERTAIKLVVEPNGHPVAS
jgi:stage V sporulation protein S